MLGWFGLFQSIATAGSNEYAAWTVAGRANMRANCVGQWSWRVLKHLRSHRGCPVAWCHELLPECPGETRGFAAWNKPAPPRIPKCDVGRADGGGSLLIQLRPSARPCARYDRGSGNGAGVYTTCRRALRAGLPVHPGRHVMPSKHPVTIDRRNTLNPATDGHDPPQPVGMRR
jgi:hypothetical protein